MVAGMSDQIRFTILGCGSSGGVPRLGGHWGACDPTNPKNKRRRCSLLVERDGPQGATRVLIDASPDMREQLLDAGVGELDAVAITHPHADHCHGLDDLRQVVFNTRKRLPIWTDGPTSVDLMERFGYVFETPPGSSYPPILDHYPITGPIEVDGAGGRVTLEPFTVRHGRIDALGFRIGGLAYLPDVSAMTDEAWEAVRDLDIWVVDALRRAPHPSHSHLAQTLDWIARAAPRRAVLTNLHNDLDYDTVAGETPDHITPAHDGMVLAIGLP